MWSAGDGITINGPITTDVTPQGESLGVPTLYVQEGQQVTVSISASDLDKWTLKDEEGTDSDTLTYKWKVISFGEEGDLSSPESSSTGWIVPPVVGDNDGMMVSLECTVDDTPKQIGEDEDGERGDGEKKETIDFRIVRLKWLVGSGIGQHPQRDENGNFDIDNVTWVDDGEIIAPAPDEGPHQVVEGGSMALEVSEAQDWDEWFRDQIDGDLSRDAPLSYTWTASKGHFLVLDEKGEEIQASSVSGRRAMWVAPDHLGTPTTKVDIKCTIDDAPDARVGATDAGTRDDEALERTVNVTVRARQPVQFKFAFGKMTLVAGGLGSEPHQTHVKVTVTNPDGTIAKNQEISLSVDTLLPGESTPISEDDPDADLRAILSSSTATTNEEGVATVLLTSSKRIGATATVKASVGDEDDESESISMEDASGQMSVDADEIDADGESEVGVYLILGDEDNPVVGHSIRFYIDSVEDDEGQQVQPASDGTFPGYGSVTTAEGATDESGVAYGIYTAGTLGGTITFGSEDTTVVDKIILTSRNQAQSNFRLTSCSFVEFQLAQLTVYPQRQGTKRTKQAGGGQRPVARVSLDFFELVDDHGNVASRKISDAAMVSNLNSVWTARANIKFYRVKGSPLTWSIDDASTIPHDRQVAMKIHTSVQAALPSIKRPAASLTVYYCKAIKSTLVSDTGQVGGFAARGGPYIFIGPHVTNELVAHKSGHSLNLPHFVEALVKDGVRYEDPKYIKHRKNLMYWRYSKGSVLLNKEQRDEANSYARSHFH